jgi:alkaline phosphatase
LLGLFGVKGGHLPFQTADGDFVPTFDVRGAEKYSEADVSENPTVGDMTTAALRVLSTPVEPDESGIAPFWLMVEAGDVDWANHANNLDNSIGAVLSGEAAFESVTKWVEANDAWDDTLVVVTADHGHFLVLKDTAAIAEAGQNR